MKKVTLFDISQRTGYSVNTVSHALKDKSDISEKTKKLIKNVAKELGYIGNSSASYLRSGKSKSVAVIVSDISNPHFSIMIKEIEAHLRKSGYGAFVLNTDEDEETERQAILSALEKNVDGVIICPVQKSKENIKFLQNTEVPFVLLGRRFTDEKWDYVVCDDENGGYTAAKGLLGMGHKKILYLSGPRWISSSRERLAGIKRAFEKENNSDAKLFEMTVPAVLLGDESAMVKMLEEYKDCSAIIAFSDMVALEVCHALKLMKKRVPEDVSVVGFDNIVSKFFLPLMLTSVSSSKTNMSVAVVDILMEKIDGRDGGKHHKLVLPTKLILRETTAKL